ncbi:MAG TPA: hypothetical protein VFX62_00940, partial [Erythrobacter sp.]|nr:hypothetical protein [Erythrobacter sp.]
PSWERTHMAFTKLALAGLGTLAAVTLASPAAAQGGCDRAQLQNLADLYQVDVPAHENEALLAKILELRAEWDPKLREQIDEIVKRGR